MASATRLAAGKVGLGLAAFLTLLPEAANAAAVDLYYERTLMSVANARCGLFSPQIASALNASTVQARGAALRAGVEPDDLLRVEARAKAKARAEPCASPAFATAAARIKTAFAGYARLSKMNYPGEHLDWKAERLVPLVGRSWTLSQSVPFGADLLTFGLAGHMAGNELMAVVKFVDGAEPYAARLVMRDVARSTRPYLDHRRAGANGVLPLNARITPRSATRTFMADAKGAPDVLITPAKVKGAIAYRFPAAAQTALTGLDPREAIEIEFLFSSRSGQDVVRRAHIEVGDFAAGRAFLSAAAR